MNKSHPLAEALSDYVHAWARVWTWQTLRRKSEEQSGSLVMNVEIRPSDGFEECFEALEEIIPDSRLEGQRESLKSLYATGTMSMLEAHGGTHQN